MYRNIIKDAWRMTFTWKNKYLWFFGIFAGILSSAGAGAWNLLIENTTRVFNQPQYFEDLETLYQSKTLEYLYNNLQKFFTTPTFENIGVLLVVVVIFSIVLWLSLASQGALISASNALSNKEKTTIEKDFSQGMSAFWRLLGLNAITRLALYGLGIILAVPLISLYLLKQSETAGLIFGLASFVILLPLSILMYFLLLYASVYVVINKSSITHSATQGWHLLRKHWLPSLEFAFVLFVINAVIGLVLALVFIVPILSAAQNGTVLTGFSLWGIILALLVLLLAHGALTAFQFVASVLFVKQLTSEDAPQGILRRIFIRLFRIHQA